MTDYYNKYKNLIQVNTVDSIVAANKELANDNFNSALFSENVLVDGVEYQAIFKQEKKNEDKKLIFRPDIVLNIGAVVELNDKSYLITDFKSEGINEIYPTAVLKLTNSTYPIKSNETRVLILDENGKPKLNKFGDPQYKVIEGTITNVPCIVENKLPTNDESRGQILLPQGQLLITLPYDNVKDTEGIKVNHSFNMYQNTYQIRSVDYTKVINDKGLVTINVEVISDKPDKVVK